ncbi:MULTISPECIES: hypothetical protein [Pseudoalteromonas]|uniref:Uncharacterized protein n=1 Tax=Pseudoalteromonas aliena SW19 TaxID=1314866 RepID=A0ABR9E2S1_9GAMM|nr:MULTISPECIES: hypothetical protein [Pseudoalteromonas]MBE0360146.1 hypothetical protein [Pseudoalteromonas aliena SW19]
MSDEHPVLLLSAEDKQWLTELTQKMASSQKGLVKLNTELLTLCSHLGNNLLPKWVKPQLGGLYE